MKKKQCQSCQRRKEIYYENKVQKTCKNVPRQECRTHYVNECKSFPYKQCNIAYKDKCWNERKCKTEYKTKCVEVPSYGAPKKKCEKIPHQKCQDVKKCSKEPFEDCSTKYKNKCKKVPKETCSEVNDKKCENHTLRVPKTKINKSCHWPAHRDEDKFCVRRSDLDILLDESTEYQENMDYLGRELGENIDFRNVFPADYEANPE